AAAPFFTLRLFTSLLFMLYFLFFFFFFQAEDGIRDFHVTGVQTCALPISSEISVHWKLISEGLVRLEWQESGGPPVAPVRGRGFGTDLIERIVAHELKHEVKLDFRPEGVRCVLTIPVRQPTQFSMRASRMSARENRPPASS